MKSVLFFVFVAMFCVPVITTAQTRMPRSYLHDSARIGRRVKYVELTSSGNLVTSDDVSTPTGVTNPGGIYLFLSGENSDENALICGLNGNGQGVVEHWKRVLPGGYQKQGSTMSMPEGQQDFLGVAYMQGANKLYLLDGVSKMIFENTWDGVNQIPSIGWAPWATSGMVSELLDAELYQLKIANWLTPSRVVLSAEFVTLEYNGPPVFMHWDSGFHVERFVNQTTRAVDFDPYSMSEGNSAVVVRGAYNKNVEVVACLDSAIIGTGTIPSNEDNTTVNLSRSLAIGGKYLVREVGVQTDQNLFGALCPVRYGYSEPLSSGVSMSGMHYPLGHWIGSSFMSYLSTSKDVEPGTNATFAGYMAFALRDQYGQDPVVQVGNNWLLNTLYYIDVTGYVSRPNGHLAGYLSIPNDPALIGAVLLTQFWIQDGETYRLSQIIGAKIEGQEELLRATSGGSSRASSLPLDQKFNVKTGGDAIVAQILKQRAK